MEYYLFFMDSKLAQQYFRNHDKFIYKFDLYEFPYMIHIHSYLLFLFLPGITRLVTRPAAIKPLPLSILLSLQLTTGDETSNNEDSAPEYQSGCASKCGRGYSAMALQPSCCCTKVSCAIFILNVRKKQYQVATTVNQINLSSGTQASINVI